MMGFFDKVKKAFGSKKDDVESQNTVNEKLTGKSEPIESLDDEKIQSNDLEETSVNEEVIDKPTPNNKIRNFEYLDNLIHSGMKEIVLDSDIVLGDGEKSEYKDGIRLDVDDLTIDGNGHKIDAQKKTRIFDCTAKNITIKKITLKNGFAEYGGAIKTHNGSLTITESTLQENIAEFYGGAIHNDKCSLTITESTLQENTAGFHGGAIHNYGELTITESTLQENTANIQGGAINNWRGEITITESTLQENTARKAGAINNGGGNFKIFNCEFLTNKSPNNIILNKDSLQIHNTIFKDNKSEYIILNEDDGANLGIFNGKFKENNVAESVLWNTGKFCSVEKTVFQNNILNNTMNIINNTELTLINPKIKDEGKSILNHKYILIRKSPPELENTVCGEGTVEIDEQMLPQGENFDFGYLDKKIHESNTKEIILDHDITFENYERDFYEGGIELDIDNLIIDGNGKTINGSDKSRIFIITGKNITLKNIIFKNGRTHKNYDNSINNNGGAIKNNYNNNITIKNCEFINNTSENHGGAIHNSDGSLIITESALNNNTAQKEGGAINTYNGEIIIIESTLQENTANIHGGAIKNDGGSLSITESTINKNTAYQGGAIKTYKGEITITESTLTENTAQGSGGAIHNWESEITITGSTLQENTAEFYGGAIHNYDGELTITDSTLNNNTANNGGAIYLYNATIYESENCTFKDNKPDDVYEDK